MAKVHAAPHRGKVSVLVNGVPCPCPGGCSHTAYEHRAFDAGLAAGERGEDSESCPEDLGALGREVWLTGHAIGVSNRDALVLELLPGGEP